MGFFDFLKIGYTGRSSLVSLDLSRRIKDDWDEIELQLRGGSPSQLKQALISADKELDSALKEVVLGEGMAARLKNARDLFERYTYQKVWDAHRLRNNLVHEVGFSPQHFLIKEAINNIKNALIKLGVNL